MKLKNFFFLLLLFISATSFCQQVTRFAITPENADCNCPVLIKDTVFGPTNAPSGFGKEMEISGSKGSLYEFEKEHNSVWYYFKTPFDCDLTFDITPLSKKDDYDFILYKYNGANFCKDVKNKTVTPVRSCISRNNQNIDGKTGLSYGAADTYIHSGPGPSYSKMLQVKRGETYYLVVDNVYGNGKGHTINLHYKNCKKPVVVTDKNKNNKNNNQTPKKQKTNETNKTTEPEKSTININIVDKKTGALVNASVRVYVKKYKLEDPLLQKDSVSSSSFSVGSTSSYLIKTSAYNYFENTKEVKLSGKSENLIVKIELDKIEVGENVIFDNILFFGNQAKFLPESTNVLESILKTLTQNSKMTIEIHGHVNCPTSISDCDKMEDFNQKLSVLRAKAVYDYLVEQGIEENRLSFRGFGSSKMIYPEAKSEAQMKLNRRVEIKIVSK
jgi:outer membrane protein OmpA-like peptidoglycan-associated protein